MISTPQRILAGVAAPLYVAAGAMHFVATNTYLKVMPPYLPRPAALVYISGVAEVLGGIGLLIPPLRRAAGIGLAILLVAVFPANVYMATHHVQPTGVPIPSALLWARLPFQGLLIWWVLACTRPTA